MWLVDRFRQRRKTANLDDSLDPGETVVYRTRGRSVAPTAIFLGLTVIILIAIATAILIDAVVRTHGAIHWDAIWGLPMIIGGFATFGAIPLLIDWARQRRNPDDFMITDRRILFADNYWVDWIALSQVERVSWAERGRFRYPTIIADGQTIWLSHLRERDAAVRAIANATGTAAPPALGPMAVLDSASVGVIAALAVICPGVQILQGRYGLPAFGASNTLDGALTFLLVLTVAVSVALWLGKSAGELATVTIMRPFLTADQMQAGLCAGRPDKRRLRVALIWASLLYGRSLPYTAG